MKLLTISLIACVLFGCSKRNDTTDVTIYCYSKHPTATVFYKPGGTAHQLTVASNELTNTCKFYPEDFKNGQISLSNDSFATDDSLFLRVSYDGKTGQNGYAIKGWGGVTVQFSEVK